VRQARGWNARRFGEEAQIAAAGLHTQGLERAKDFLCGRAAWCATRAAAACRSAAASAPARWSKAFIGTGSAWRREAASAPRLQGGLGGEHLVEQRPGLAGLLVRDLLHGLAQMR
jgi:hypothetical protein